jgi:hypothetical protein
MRDKVALFNETALELQERGLQKEVGFLFGGIQIPARIFSRIP